jgi:hypothetical protein
MPKLFQAPAYLDVSRGRGEILSDRSVCAILIEKLTIDPRQFESKDLGSTREGMLTVRCSDQLSAFSFKESRSFEKKDLNKLIYAGLNPGRIALQLDLIESDEPTRQFLSDVGMILSAVGGPLSLAHPAFQPGANLFAGLLYAIKGTIDDDREHGFFEVVDGPIRNGMKLNFRFGFSRQKPLLSLRLKVLNLGEVEIGNNLSVRLEAPELVFNRKAIKPGKRVSAALSSRRVRGPRRAGANSIPARNLAKLIEARRFNVEAAVGRKQFAWSGPFQASQRLVRWNQAELFEVKAGRGTNLRDRHLLPLSLHVSLANEELNLDDWLGLLPHLAELAEDLELIEGASVKTVVRKASQQAAGFLTELSPQHLSLFSFNGMAILDPKGGQSIPDGQGLMGISQIDDGLWEKKIDSPIEWLGQEAGRFRCKLLVRELD